MSTVCAAKFVYRFEKAHAKRTAFPWKPRLNTTLNVSMFVAALSNESLCGQACHGNRIPDSRKSVLSFDLDKST
jgi:hypothetical protein